uniref:Uncharacterized protein n=1 Tax=Anguilla anguilla TaxID=7936 RepID=A0A0E9VZ44_ANGAN
MNNSMQRKPMKLSLPQADKDHQPHTSITKGNSIYG